MQFLRKHYNFFIVFALWSIFDFIFAQDKSVTTDATKVTKNVGENVSLIFYTDIPNTAPERQKVKAFYIEYGNIIIANGPFQDFSKAASAPPEISPRLTVPAVLLESTRQTYTITITNLNINDTGYYNATMLWQDTTPILIKAAVYLDVLGGPTKCDGATWPPEMFLNEGTGDVTMETTACGNPRPTVTFTIDGINSNLSYTVVNGYQHQYIYTAQLPLVTSSFCGKNISYELAGHNGVIKESTKMNVSFSPPKPSLINAYAEGSCTKSIWSAVDIGKCSGIIYDVVYLCHDNSTVYTHTVAMGTEQHSFCNASLVSDVSYVKIRSSRDNKFSQYDQVKVDFTQKPWGPYKCSTPLENPINVDATKNNNNFTLTLCGNPKPSFTFTLDGNEFDIVQTSSTGNQQHKFVNIFKSISSSMCGKTFTYVATANENQVMESVILSGTFLPKEVSSISASRSFVCTYVSWSKVDYGNCNGLYYEIAYVLGNGSLFENKNVSMTALNDTTCISIEIANITHVQLRTWIGVRYSNWTRVPVIIQPTTSAIIGDSDDNWPLIIGLIVGFSLFLLLLIFLVVCCRCYERKKEQKVLDSVRRYFVRRKIKKSRKSSVKTKSSYKKQSRKHSSPSRHKGKTNYGYRADSTHEYPDENQNKRHYVPTDISAPIIETIEPAPTTTLSYNTMRTTSENITLNNQPVQSPETLTSYSVRPAQNTFVIHSVPAQNPTTNEPKTTYLYGKQQQPKQPKVYGMYLPPEHFEMQQAENV